MKSVYATIGLPVSTAELGNIGVQKPHILQGLDALRATRSKSILVQVDSVILDQVYP